ncbi:hypothetical protein ACJX0J_003415 [Zea mays]
MPIGVPKDTFFSAYYRARTPEFLLEVEEQAFWVPKAYGLWVDFLSSILDFLWYMEFMEISNKEKRLISQYLLMKERAPVGAHLRLNRVNYSQVLNNYSKLIHNLNIQE